MLLLAELAVISFVRKRSLPEKCLIILTLRSTESNAAEYLKPFRSLSYSFSLFFRALSTRNSSASPSGSDFTLALTRPCPVAGKEVPRKDSNVPERRAETENDGSVVVASEALDCRRRTERVPSDMPAAM
jgi:hypothetical protein